MIAIVDTKTCFGDQYDEKTWEVYRQSPATYIGGGGQFWDTVYMDEIDKFLTSDTVLLDVGCGDGDFLLSEICKARPPKLSKSTIRPKEIFAVDNSSCGIEAFGEQLAQFDEDDLPKMHLFKGNLAKISEFGIPKCDLIISRYVMHYLTSLDEIKHSLEQLRNLLKPKGHLVFLTKVLEPREQPSAEAAFEELPRGNQVPVILPPDVKLTVRGFSVSEIMYACHAAGFSVNTAVVIGGKSPVVQDRHHDGEPFPREKFKMLSLIISCVREQGQRLGSQ